MTRKQLLLAAVAVLVVLGGVLATLLSGNLVGIMVLGACAVILMAAAGTWVRLRLMRTAFDVGVKREDDDHHRALKAQHGDATSPVDRGVAFRQARAMRGTSAGAAGQ